MSDRLTFAISLTKRISQRDTKTQNDCVDFKTFVAAPEYVVCDQIATRTASNVDQAADFGRRGARGQEIIVSSRICWVRRASAGFWGPSGEARSAGRRQAPAARPREGRARSPSQETLLQNHP